MALYKIYIALLFLPAFLEASGAEFGAPVITNFGPRDFGAGSQNWCVLQDQRGLIYIGNSRGVLEFDGVHWRLIQLSNNATALSLAVDGNNTIFVGGKGEFGYLQPNAKGSLIYNSLLPCLPPEELDFGDVWETLVVNDSIYFRTAKRLFRYIPSDSIANGRISSWRPENQFHVAFKAQNSIFLRDVGIGLKRVHGDELLLEPDSEVMANEAIYANIGAANSMLLVTRPQGLVAYDGKSFLPRNSKAARFIRKRRIIHSTRLKDGNAAVATIDSGVIFIDADDDIIHHISKKSGLRDNTVWYVMQDREGGLWCALNNGIARIEFPSSMTFFDDRNGLDGTAQDIIRYNGDLYIATSPRGVFRLQSHHGEDGVPSPEFVPVGGIATQSWHFAKVKQHLLVATNDGIYEIKKNKAKHILADENLDAAFLCESRYDSNRVFAGLFDGLAIIRLNHGAWLLEKLIKFNNEIRSIMEEDEGVLWLGTRTRGAYRITLSQSGSLISAKSEHFAASDGLPPGQVFVFPVDGRPFFTTEDQGVYSFDELSQRFKPSMTFGAKFSDGSCDIELIAQSTDGRRVWLGAGESGSLAQLIKTEDGEYAQVNNALKRLPRSAIRAIYPEDDGVVWISTNEGLCRFDARAQQRPNSDYSAYVRRVTLHSDSLLYDGLPAKSPKAPRLFYNANSVRIEFAAAAYNAMPMTSFQTFLQGFDKNWSPWTHEKWKEYTNLPPGKYNFKVHARNVMDNISQEDSFQFRVLPPWYRTLWAYAGCFLLLAAFFFLVDRFQRSRLTKRERERSRVALLEAENQRRNEEFEQARRLQLSMLPENLPEVHGISLAAFMKTATEVGGDYYDFSASDGELIGAIGDATGHGLNAGMMVSITKSLFVSESSQRSVLDFFNKCNTVLRQMHMERIFMALSIFKIKNNRLRMSSAGMPPVYWYKAAEDKVEEISPKGMPLGATDRYPYQCEERELAKNDVLLLMTDGFPELFNQQDKIIGYDQIPFIFADHARKEPEAIIDALKQHIDLWSEGRPNDDDITFIALKIT